MSATALVYAAAGSPPMPRADSGICALCGADAHGVGFARWVRDTFMDFDKLEPWPEDWSCYRDGQPMRAIPADDGILYGVRPSYWSPKNQVPCRLPH